MIRKLSAFSTAVILVFIGCINVPNKFEARIYIDIRHIQEQANQVLDYVEGKTDTVPDLRPAPEKSSFLRDAIEFVSPIRVAYAQELDEGSARAKQILASMRKRFAELEQVKKTGAVGENNRGMVALAKGEALGSAEETNEVQRVVAAENNDRKAFYQEIARINRDQNLAVGAVERAYAQERLLRAKKGELFQLPPAGRDFDSFKDSRACKQLGAACSPGAWVVIP